MRCHTPTLLITLLLGAAAGAFAQGAEPIGLKLSMLAVKTVKVDGKMTEQLVANPGSVNPGDVLSQLLNVQNNTARAVRDLPVTLPVPKSTIYMAPEKGMNDAKTTYSIDGGKTFASAPLKKTITVTEDGKSVQKEVEVKPSEYNAVRWIVAALNPGEQLKLGYRIQVK